MCRVTSLADVINKPPFFVPLVTTVPNLLISSYSPEWWEILMHKVSSIAVFMQSAMYYKLMPFWTTTEKKILFPPKTPTTYICLDTSVFFPFLLFKHKLCSDKLHFAWKHFGITKNMHLLVCLLNFYHLFFPFFLFLIRIFRWNSLR